MHVITRPGQPSGSPSPTHPPQHAAFQDGEFQRQEPCSPACAECGGCAPPPEEGPHREGLQGPLRAERSAPTSLLGRDPRWGGPVSLDGIPHCRASLRLRAGTFARVTERSLGELTMGTRPAERTLPWTYVVTVQKPVEGARAPVLTAQALGPLQARTSVPQDVVGTRTGAWPVGAAWGSGLSGLLSRGPPLLMG